MPPSPPPPPMPPIPPIIPDASAGAGSFVMGATTCEFAWGAMKSGTAASGATSLQPPSPCIICTRDRTVRRLLPDIDSSETISSTATVPVSDFHRRRKHSTVPTNNSSKYKPKTLSRLLTSLHVGSRSCPRVDSQPERSSRSFARYGLSTPRIRESSG